MFLKENKVGGMPWGHEAQGASNTTFLPNIAKPIHSSSYYVFPRKLQDKNNIHTKFASVSSKGLAIWDVFQKSVVTAS